MTVATEPRVFDPNAVQHRAFTLQNLEVRAGDGGEPPKIRGYAAVFNEWADIIPGIFREQIAPGAFKKTIGEADIRALVNHDPNYVLGRNRAGTLSLHEDKHGLAVEIEPPESQWARDLMVSMKRGDISQMSFGFRPVRWTEQDHGRDQPLDVTLQEARLFDVSVVTFPAYPQTEAWARSAIASIEHYLLSAPGTAHPDGGPPVTTDTRAGIDHPESAAETTWQDEIAEIRSWQELADQ